MSGHEVNSFNGGNSDGKMSSVHFSPALRCIGNAGSPTPGPSLKSLIPESNGRELQQHSPIDGIQTMISSNSFDNSTSPHPLANSNIETPAITSVWLEQGEYFFDDEFAVQMDDNLRDSNEVNKYSLMTQSMNSGHVAQHKPSFAEQSYSDSCLFSPAGSAESTSSDANNMRLAGKQYIFHRVCGKNVPGNDGYRNHSPVSSKFIPYNSHQRRNMRSPDKTSDNISEQSFNGSRVSCSTSWIQMLMERSCNPELRALINRTAAAVDYRLAYGDTVALQQQLEESMIQTPLMSTKNELSSSQGNLLTATGLAGLRHALDQTTRLLPTRTAAENATLCSIGVSADLISDTTLSPTKSKNSTEFSAANTTTWAKKHGSRESLRRKSSKDAVLFPSLDAKCELLPDQEPKNTWRAIKEANSNLITWNQLKRTVKRAESIGKTSSVHESRRNQHDNSINCTDNHTASKLLTNRFANRSHSQPVNDACHMHRFSGTLLEIFMRAKMRDVGSTTAHSDGSVIQLNDSSHKEVNESTYSNPQNRQNNVVRGPLKVGIFDDTHVPNIKKSTPLHTALITPEDSKHPLLRGDRILPQKHSPIIPSLTNAVMGRSMRNFGVQFPALEESRESKLTNVSVTNNLNKFIPTPILSNKLPSHNVGTNALLNYYTAVRRSHPQPLYLTRPQSVLAQHLLLKHDRSRLSGEQSSPVGSKQIAACLTASVGPDSPYMTALRAGCAAQGFAVGWLGNPRTSIAYPGLGLLSVPRPSRLAGSAFLSHTLPDLSFLSQAGAEEERKGTPTMSKRQDRGLSSLRFHRTCRCKRCGCRSTSAGCWLSKNTCAHPPKSVHDKDGIVNKFDGTIDHNNNMDSNTCNTENFMHNNSKSTLYSSHRSLSEPDLVDVEIDTHAQTIYGSLDSIALCNSNSQKRMGGYAAIPNNNSSEKFVTDCGDIPTKPKKSVSFNGNIRLWNLNGNGRSRQINRHSDPSAQPSPEPKVIPRNWGLYGQEQPLAEFNPHSSPVMDRGQGRCHQKYGAFSDVDVRYQAMVNDVINAVQETVSFYCNVGMRTKGDIRCDENPHGSFERQPLLTIVTPLTTLLCDGLLPPTKPIFTSRPRTRLWQLVEESCRPGALPAGVAYHVLNDAVNQVKSLTNVTLEKTKFKAFVCACLNAKALPMWLNAVVVNDNLLRRFYCENAFIRQCRTVQRELYADLMTHLEQLLTFPFDLDISMETRRSINEPQSLSHLKTTPNHSSGSPIMAKKQMKSPEYASYPVKHMSQTKIPPATVITRRQIMTTNNSLNSRIPSATTIVSPSSSTNQTTGVNHYHQNHLPSQRSSRRISKTQNLRLSNDDDSPISSTLSGEEPRSTSNKTANGGLSPANSQVRGKLKIALSSFRRGTSQPTNKSSSRPTNVTAHAFTQNTDQKSFTVNYTNSGSHCNDNKSTVCTSHEAHLKIKARPEPPKSLLSGASKCKYQTPKLKSSPSK